ncbi:MAG: hypothetical protein LBM72_00830 [Mycoplasmataceae bacterium]|nr:hypothetical protein [Mycoplasmataceae bacterium]
MGNILDEVWDSYKNKHFYICLYCLLSLIDVCSKHEFKNNKKYDGHDDIKYQEWVDKYFKYDSWSGKQLYKYRNSILHESSNTFIVEGEKIKGVFCFEVKNTIKYRYQYNEK